MRLPSAWKKTPLEGMPEVRHYVHPSGISIMHEPKSKWLAFFPDDLVPFMIAETASALIDKLRSYTKVQHGA